MNYKFLNRYRQRLKLFQILLIFFVSSISLAEEEKSAGKIKNANIFTAEDINRMNVSSITELLETVPGVTTVGELYESEEGQR